MSKRKQIGKGQARMLTGLIRQWAGKDRRKLLWITSGLLDMPEPPPSVNSLSTDDWYRIRDAAYPNLDSEVSPEFAAQAQALAEQYQEQVLHQLRLFD